MKFLKQTLFFIIVGITISITFCSTTYAATAYSKLSLPPSQSSEDNLADSVTVVFTQPNMSSHLPKPPYAPDQEITILLPAPSKKETLS